MKTLKKYVASLLVLSLLMATTAFAAENDNTNQEMGTSNISSTDNSAKNTTNLDNFDKLDKSEEVDKTDEPNTSLDEKGKNSEGESNSPEDIDKDKLDKKGTESDDTEKSDAITNGLDTKNEDLNQASKLKLEAKSDPVEASEIIVGGTDENYPATAEGLNRAISYIKDNGTIKLASDVEAEAPIYINNNCDKSFTLDGQNHAINALFKTDNTNFKKDHYKQGVISIENTDKDFTFKNLTVDANNEVALGIKLYSVGENDDALVSLKDVTIKNPKGFGSRGNIAIQVNASRLEVENLMFDNDHKLRAVFDVDLGGGLEDKRSEVTVVGAANDVDTEHYAQFDSAYKKLNRAMIDGGIEYCLKNAVLETGNLFGIKYIKAITSFSPATSIDGTGKFRTAKNFDVSHQGKKIFFDLIKPEPIKELPIKIKKHWVAGNTKGEINLDDIKYLDPVFLNHLFRGDSHRIKVFVDKIEVAKIDLAKTMTTEDNKSLWEVPYEGKASETSDVSVKEYMTIKLGENIMELSEFASHQYESTVKKEDDTWKIDVYNKIDTIPLTVTKEHDKNWDKDFTDVEINIKAKAGDNDLFNLDKTITIDKTTGKGSITLYLPTDNQLSYFKYEITEKNVSADTEVTYEGNIINMKENEDADNILVKIINAKKTSGNNSGGGNNSDGGNNSGNTGQNGSGNNGGNSSGGGDIIPFNPNKETNIDIPDSTIPEAIKDETVVEKNTETPQTTISSTKNEAEIMDEDVPEAGNLPETGGIPNMAYMSIAYTLIGAGIFIRRKK